MAELENSRKGSQLSLDLGEALELHKSGKSYCLGSGVPVTQRLYDQVFKKLQTTKELCEILPKITRKSLNEAWQILAPAEKDQKREPMYDSLRPAVRIVPYIAGIDESTIRVALPIGFNSVTCVRYGLTCDESSILIKHCLGYPDLTISCGAIMQTLEMKTVLIKGRFDIKEEE
ncbi:MAG: hypothetical protein JWN37_468 [Candidatus Nomurabacteria bacterium]|nr:hypothetical protein [Candidatus Nomurabacteria bacterium]